MELQRGRPYVWSERKPAGFDRLIQSGSDSEEREKIKMKMNSVRKLTFAAMLCATAVIGSLFSVPVFGSKCAPVQHMVNIFCAILLGPWYGTGVAFCASLLRNMMGLGSIMAFPGSMIGALLCGLAWKYTRNLWLTLGAEVFGTGILGGLCAYPLAVAFLGVNAGEVAFYAYIVPFLISTVAGALLSAVLLEAMSRTVLPGLLKQNAVR